MSQDNVSTWSAEKVGAAEKRITMSDQAIAHLKRQIAKRGAGVGMRLGLKKSGCSGYRYTVELIDAQEADDKVYSIQEGLIVVVAPKHLPYLQGTAIDYLKKGLSANFIFSNPNEAGSCGCGESFSVDSVNGE